MEGIKKETGKARESRRKKREKNKERQKEKSERNSFIYFESSAPFIVKKWESLGSPD